MGHTPGRWKAEEKHGVWQVYIGPFPVVRIHADLPHAEADACLIAAAPDLLAACELLLAENTEEKPGCSCAVCRTIRACREAVARARGEEPAHE